LRISGDVAQRLAQTSRPLDWDERREIIHISAFVFRVEPVISRRDRDGLLSHFFAQRFFHQSHIEMRSVVRSDDKIRMLRNVRFAFDFRI
jgi:hypothetical protein